MNRRLFFMFLTTLAKSPTLQMRNVIPQIQVINAFKSSTKRKENGVSSPTWKVNIAKKVENAPSAPEVIQLYETETKKKSDEPEKEECTRRKKNGECDSDEDDSDSGKFRIRNKRGHSDADKKEKMTESCRNWQVAKGRIGKQQKWK